MHKARKNSKSISLTGDATGGTPAERGRDVGETVAAGPVRSFQDVLRRFYHMTPLGFYSSSGILSWRRSRTFGNGVGYHGASISSLHTHIFSNRFVRTSAVMTVFLLALLTSAILVPLYNKLDITEAATGTAKESSLSFNLTNSTASVDLSVNDINGTFASSSTNVGFNISTTNYTGYTLSIQASNNSQQLINSDNSNIKLNSISSTINYDIFNSNDSYNNTWGYLPSKLNSSANTNYLPAPTTTASTLDKTTTANSSANSYTIGIGARASYTTPAGEYTGTYILTAIGNPINYTVTYNKNTTDTVSSLPANVSSSTSQTYITLSNNTPTREGYTFLGWCLGTITTTTNNVDTCTGTTYQPGNSFYIDQESANLPTLLAMWEKDKVYMQNLASSACTTTASEVVDSRDGTTYTIQRLADGNCWLLDNLALDLVTYKDNITADNTNATTAQLNYLKNGGGTTSDQYAITGVSVWTESSSYASSYSFSDPLYQMSGKCGASNKHCVTNTAGGDWSYTSTTGSANDGTDKYPGKVGAYYNYCAATAGTYCYGSGTSAGSPSGNASADICPYGWRLPTSGSSGEFQALYTAYSSNYANFRSALGVPLSGYFFDVAFYQGLYGYFWSSTYVSTDGMYSLNVTTSNVSPALYSSRRTGVSVRCILRDQSASISSAAYLQDITSDMAYNMSVGATATLKDNRDNTSYKVGKLADGDLWLLENLRLNIANTTTLNKMSASNTNATATALNYLKGTSTGTASNQWATSKAQIWTSSSYASSYSYSNPLIQISGSCYNATYCTDGSTQTWSSTSNTSTANNGADVYPGKVGVYYNYCAATAGSYCYGSGTNTGSPSDNAMYDICPYSWRLPTGGSNGEFKTLYTAYDNNYANFRNATQIPLAGYFDSGVAKSQGGDGDLWTSTYYSASHMYYLIITTTSIGQGMGTNLRYRGLPIRCIFAG